MGNYSYFIIYLLALELLIIVAIYAYKHRHIMDEMHGMMVGMTLGMFSGLVTATLYLIPTGNFLNGVIIGSLVGLAFGISLGKLGGHLGIMEGVMAGPMGGMMGAMLGQMIRPFSIEVFVPFFMFILLVTMIGITYAINCKANLVNKPDEVVDYRLDNKFVMFWTAPVVLLLLVSFLLPFSVKATVSESLGETKGKQAISKNGVQEVDLTVDSNKYSPSTIIANKGVPLKINVKTNGDSCAREIVFPDLGIDKIIDADSSGVIKINNPKPGTYIFRCPMDMVQGKLIVR